MLVLRCSLWFLEQQTASLIVVYNAHSALYIARTFIKCYLSFGNISPFLPHNEKYQEDEREREPDIY